MATRTRKKTPKTTPEEALDILQHKIPELLEKAKQVVAPYSVALPESIEIRRTGSAAGTIWRLHLFLYTSGSCWITLAVQYIGGVIILPYSRLCGYGYDHFYFPHLPISKEHIEEPLKSGRLMPTSVKITYEHLEKEIIDILKHLIIIKHCEADLHIALSAQNSTALPPK